MSLEEIQAWLDTEGYSEEWHTEEYEPGKKRDLLTSNILLDFLQHISAERAKGVTVTVDIETIPVYAMGEGPLWPEPIHTRTEPTQMIQPYNEDKKT